MVDIDVTHGVIEGILLKVGDVILISSSGVVKKLTLVVLVLVKRRLAQSKKLEKKVERELTPSGR